MGCREKQQRPSVSSQPIHITHCSWTLASVLQGGCNQRAGELQLAKRLLGFCVECVVSDIELSGTRTKLRCLVRV